ncbi:MAG: hypothetical protein H7839_10600 [Magnetococcus sp. YQC-5]
MNEWLKVRNDAFQALSQAESRARELKERFKNTKKKIFQLTVFLTRAEHVKERSLVAYSTNPRSPHLQDELTEIREKVALTRQELADLEALLEASKGEFRFLRRELPLLRKAFADAEQLFWFALFEGMQDRIRQTIGAEVEKAYAAYSATFTRDLSYDSFLRRVFPVPGDMQRMADIRKELARDYPLGTQESTPTTYSLTAPDPGSQESILTPSDEARQWAQLVR